MDLLLEFFIKFIGARFMNTGPRMSRRGDVLIVKSHWKQQLWTLGSSSRKLEVDPHLKILRVYDRRYWLYRRIRRIEFDWISAVTWGYTPISFGLWTRYELDLFAVGVNLKNGQRVPLFRFFGMGDFVNDSIWPDFFYWSDFLAADLARGDQTSASRALADVICAMAKAPLIDPND